MDPAPQSHPILSYVLSRLPTLSNPRPASGGGDFDIEQPHVQTPSPRTPSSAGEFDLVERMPGLRHPSVLRAMTPAVADVSAARSVLQLLGPRPDPELVDSSRALITAVAAGDSQITAFAFSKENWSRLKVEVDFLMRLFERVIHDMSV